MIPKPKHASGYSPDAVSRVRRTLLLIAAKLGDLMDDIVVVGGLVPYLLVDQQDLPGHRRHVGTMDLDLGLSLALLDHERYREVSERLRGEGFRPEQKQDGNIRRQSWAHGEGREQVTVDFLVQSNAQGVAPGRLTQIERDFAAITVEGLELAFQTRRSIPLTDVLPNGSTLRRDVFVCGPSAFLVLKAKAFRFRGENKDACDLFYLLRELGAATWLPTFSLWGCSIRPFFRPWKSCGPTSSSKMADASKWPNSLPAGGTRISKRTPLPRSAPSSAPFTDLPPFLPPCRALNLPAS